MAACEASEWLWWSLTLSYRAVESRAPQARRLKSWMRNDPLTRSRLWADGWREEERFVCGGGPAGWRGAESLVLSGRLGLDLVLVQSGANKEPRIIDETLICFSSTRSPWVTGGGRRTSRVALKTPTHFSSERLWTWTYRSSTWIKGRLYVWDAWPSPWQQQRGSLRGSGCSRLDVNRSSCGLTLGSLPSDQHGVNTDSAALLGN